MSIDRSNIDSYVLPVRAFSEFVCPQCTGALHVTDGTELVCRHCSAIYPVLDGIPRFVSQNNYSDSFGYQWGIHQKTQLDSYTGLPLSKTRLEATMRGGGSLSGSKILEVGSGAGRFTEVLVKNRSDVYSFDLSSAVDVNAKNNANVENLILFQGDIYDIPFSDSYFDHVICLGVIQHTPDPKAAFMSLANKLKPGGWLYIDCYKRIWHYWLQWKYVLRPITRNMDKRKLYSICSAAVDIFLPAAKMAKRILPHGWGGGRLTPILEYSHMGLDSELNRSWAVLDTFDMYSPAYDYPQSMRTIRSWFEEAGFEDVSVEYGYNGIVGRGRREAPDQHSP